MFLVLRRRSGLFQSSISACTVYATTAACVSSRCCCRGCCGCKISPQQSWRFIPAQADNRLLDRFVVVAVVVMVVVVDDYCTPICFVYHVAVMKRNCALPTTLPELFDRPLCAGHCFTMPTISCSSVIWRPRQIRCSASSRGISPLASFWKALGLVRQSGIIEAVAPSLIDLGQQKADVNDRIHGYVLSIARAFTAVSQETPASNLEARLMIDASWAHFGE